MRSTRRRGWPPGGCDEPRGDRDRPPRRFEDLQFSGNRAPSGCPADSGEGAVDGLDLEMFHREGRQRIWVVLAVSSTGPAGQFRPSVVLDDREPPWS